MQMVLTGERVPAGDLQQAGLISRVVPAGQALEAARDLAARVAANAPLAVVASKRVMVESADWPSGEAFARQGEIIGAVFGFRGRDRGSRGLRREAPAGLARRIAGRAGAGSCRPG